MSTDAGRNELFGNAAQRQQAPRPQESGAYGQSGAYGDSSQNGGYGQASGGYGAYNDRQLTAEEQEEEDINGTKSEIRRIKEEDTAILDNTFRVAQQAEQNAMDIMARLQTQHENLHKCDDHDLAGQWRPSANTRTALNATWTLQTSRIKLQNRRLAS
jgi:hypothetical protein